MKKSITLMACFCLMLTTAFAQTRTVEQLKEYEKTLRKIDAEAINSENEMERRNSTYTFIKTLVTALKTPGSFNYPFDSLKTISITKDPSNKFRIFSWPFANEDGTYRYYGAIQINNSKQLELYPLKDYTDFIINRQDTVTSNENWFGAQYYQIIAPSSSNEPYLLLGWKGNSPKTSMRVIEPLTISDGFISMGAPILQDSTGKTVNRMIFEYSKSASMMLKYIPSKKWIVFDHLVPTDQSKKGNFEYYGPDLSYDGLKYEKGKWVYMTNINLTNEASEADELYNDPKKLANPQGIPINKKKN
ncbi:hypothetical protein C3K47_17945 [Solitalea longa]|uniref:Uncharacterized protein n=1 Tax=Solitalea longa TaxID=2079460 RepID=A0A2S4ZX21_9SPHI|nr:hypothetical protein [Solitalea longa]POY34836.1 hypothetical protein C3K47_17945 [Solitalea longa]